MPKRKEGKQIAGLCQTEIKRSEVGRIESQQVLRRVVPRESRCCPLTAIENEGTERI